MAETPAAVAVPRWNRPRTAPRRGAGAARESQPQPRGATCGPDRVGFPAWGAMGAVVGLSLSLRLSVSSSLGGAVRFTVPHF